MSPHTYPALVHFPVLPWQHRWYMDNALSSYHTPSQLQWPMGFSPQSNACHSVVTHFPPQQSIQVSSQDAQHRWGHLEPRVLLRSGKYCQRKLKVETGLKRWTAHQQGLDKKASGKHKS